MRSDSDDEIAPEKSRLRERTSNISDEYQKPLSFVENYDSLKSVEIFDNFNEVLGEKLLTLIERNEELKSEENKQKYLDKKVNEKLENNIVEGEQLKQKENDVSHKLSTIDDKIDQVEGQIEFEEKLFKKHIENYKGFETIYKDIKHEINREEAQSKVTKKKNIAKLEQVNQQQQELCSLINITMKRLSPEIDNLGDEYSLITEIDSDKINKIDEMLLIGKRLGILPREKGDPEATNDPLQDDGYQEKQSELNLWNLRDILTNIQENLKKEKPNMQEEI